MKIGLTGRLVLSHAAVALVAVVVFSAVLISTTGRQAVETGVAIDRATAERLAPWIEEYYRSERTWEGLDEVITPGAPRGGVPRQTPMMPGMSGTAGAPGAPMMGGRRPQPTIPRLLDRPILIVDATGGVLVSRGVVPEEIPADFVPSDGVPLQLVRGRQAFLFVGGMIEDRRNPLSALFVRSTARAAALTGLVVLLLVSGLSVFWARSFLQPIRQLHAASARLAAGEYSARVVPPPGSHELADLARGFNTMASEVEAQEESRRRFIGDAAHELRTPLSLLATRVEMLESGIYPPEATQWHALRSDIRRLNRLVDDLQTLARVDAGKLALRITPVPLQTLLKDLHRHLSPAADDSGVALVFHPPVESVSAMISVDSERFHQIMVNLVGNALRYSARGGEIRIESEPSGEGAGGAAGAGTEVGAEPDAGARLDTGARSVWIAVEDDGPGIPPEARERIFERFVRLDDDRGRSGGGSGLGLAITAELIHRHGGSIRAESARHGGSGARFVVTFPSPEVSSGGTP